MKAHVEGFFSSESLRCIRRPAHPRDAVASHVQDIECPFFAPHQGLVRKQYEVATLTAHLVQRRRRGGPSCCHVSQEGVGDHQKAACEGVHRSKHQLVLGRVLELLAKKVGTQQGCPQSESRLAGTTPGTPGRTSAVSHWKLPRRARSCLCSAGDKEEVRLPLRSFGTWISFRLER